MSLTAAQHARNLYGAAIRSKAGPEQIEQARADLEYAKAEQSITAWSTLSLRRRAHLARLLLAGDDHVPAA